MATPAALTDVFPEAFARQLRTGRELAREARRRPGSDRLPTSVDALDELLEGGLERGVMVEAIGRPSSGRFSLVLGALAAATGAGEAAALIDLGDSLDPGAAAAAGVDLRRLLWARPRRVKEALASAEAVLASGIPLVVIDLGLPPLVGGRGSEAAWLRLARAARARPTALLIASPYRASGTAAGVVLRLRARRARWSDRGPVPLLGGLALEIEQIKSRSRRPGARAALSLADPGVPRSGSEEPLPEAPSRRPADEGSSGGVLTFPRRGPGESPAGA